MKRRQASGFTLVEILTVLAIAAIISGITLGGFSSLRTSNRKTTCQTNLTQIYQACRLYAQDNEYYPYYNGPNSGIATTAQPTGGLGLWALYTYAEPTSPNDPAIIYKNATPQVPVGMYLRNLSAFHCPSDNYDRTTPTPDGIKSQQTYSQDDAVKRVINPDYLSYQNTDPTGDPEEHDTYSIFRASGARRQLEYFDGNTSNLGQRRPSDTTVLLWCRFHRNVDSAGNTISGGRNYDNVLFLDGSIQWLPSSQDVSNAAGTLSGTCKGWKRVPREYVNNMAVPSACQPTSTD